MRSSDFVVIVLCLLLQGNSCLAGDQEIHLSQEVTIAEQCNGYCFSVLKPFLDHLSEMKQTVEANKEVKDKINSLENQLKCKDDQIKLKDEQIQMKAEQITEKVEQIKSLSEQNKLKSENSNYQREQSEAKIKSLEAEIIENLGNNKTEKNKDFTAWVYVLETENTKCRDELIAKAKVIEESHAKIKDQETEIKHCQDQLTIKDGLVKSFESTLREKESQLKNLSAETELLRETREASSCLAFVNSTDIRTIRLPGLDPFDVPCNSSVSGSGWTVIQRRVDGKVDFNRNWNDYKHGFGDLRENFFLGLEKIHQMTLDQPYELYIQLGMVNGSTSYARYDDFKIGSEEEDYKLKSLGKYSGTAGDSLTRGHLNKKFTTFDRDNDINEYGHCATDFGGGWWFASCGTSSLNAKYYRDGKCSGSMDFGIYWVSWHNFDLSICLTYTQMIIRPKTL